ncbi:hypothetical protein AB0M50_12310 [Nonomuraea fuscirosea]|jgi:hypothetical protein|uniref:Uncharacterized protein n=1 Tax=Nonomuraea fuscirosea TaxID=1291556 RepID=A0A2T0MRV0_9ACTN|nr:hypothetical protein [Nonomuraea fuscirosea]PRX61207.1 hypothetical protein B0I32_11561 [Nonomuraea fuscirosea]WSA51270.1 hypothetical protein OIE67_45695 [Nonomuraea fuscirosea]
MAPTPLTPDEAARFRVTMSEWLAKELVEKGSVRLSAVEDPELQRHFQEVVHRVSEQLGRPVTSVAGRRGMTFELGAQPLTDQERPPLTP